MGLLLFLCLAKLLLHIECGNGFQKHSCRAKPEVILWCEYMLSFRSMWVVEEKQSLKYTEAEVSLENPSHHSAGQIVERGFVSHYAWLKQFCLVSNVLRNVAHAVINTTNISDFGKELTQSRIHQDSFV